MFKTDKRPVIIVNGDNNKVKIDVSNNSSCNWKVVAVIITGMSLLIVFILFPDLREAIIRLYDSIVNGQ